MVRGSRVPATYDSMIANLIDNLAHCSIQTHSEFISNSRKLESIWKHSISHSRTNRPFDVSRRLKQTFASSNNSSLSWYGSQQLLHTTMHWELRLCRTISPQRVLCCHASAYVSRLSRCCRTRSSLVKSAPRCNCWSSTTWKSRAKPSRYVVDDVNRQPWTERIGSNIHYPRRLSGANNLVGVVRSYSRSSNKEPSGVWRSRCIHLFTRRISRRVRCCQYVFHALFLVQRQAPPSLTTTYVFDSRGHCITKDANHCRPPKGRRQ